MSMGVTAENVAKKFNISRKEQQEFAILSHEKAYQAQKDKSFDNEITPININNNEIIRSFINDENCIDYSCEEISRVLCREGLNYEDLSLLLNYRETLWINRYNSCNTEHGLNRKKGPSNRGKGNEFDLAVKKYKAERVLYKKHKRVWYKSKKITKNYIPRSTNSNFKKTKN